MSSASLSANFNALVEYSAANFSWKKMLQWPKPDGLLLLAALALASIGLVMVASASVSVADKNYADPLHFFWRQAAFLIVGLMAGAVVFRLPLQFWYRISSWLLFLGIALLVLVLIPGIGREVNGSIRWIPIAGINIQVSELVKLFVIIYLAGYLQRRQQEIQLKFSGFIKPLVLLGMVVALLLLEPDFGASVVIMATAMGMMFLAGAKLVQFGVLGGSLAIGAASLIISEPYRLSRLTSFSDPWADPFGSGYQLTQALMAIGRGDWFGLGLGSSIQKMLYLPEAHTDFIISVLAEELGFAGIVLICGLFATLVWRGLIAAYQAKQQQQLFVAFCGFGISLWLGLQVIVNLGVNAGLLPTKGLTLPLISYGGSSLIVNCVAIALLMRVQLETAQFDASKAKKSSKEKRS